MIDEYHLYFHQHYHMNNVMIMIYLINYDVRIHIEVLLFEIFERVEMEMMIGQKRKMRIRLALNKQRKKIIIKKNLKFIYLLVVEQDELNYYIAELQKKVQIYNKIEIIFFNLFHRSDLFEYLA